MLKRRINLLAKRYNITLRPHQSALADTIDNYPGEGILLAWSMRAGKTLMACLLAKAKGLKVGVIAPPAVQTMWSTELAKLGINATISSFLKCPKVDYSGCETIIIDEIHAVRSRGKITNTVKNVAKIVENARFVVGLSGTLFDRDASELFYIAKFLGGDSITHAINVSGWYREYCYDASKDDRFSVMRMHKHCYREFVKCISPYISYYESQDKKPTGEFCVYQLSDTQRIWMNKVSANAYPEDWAVPARGYSLSVRNQKMLQVAGGFCLDDVGLHELIPPRSCDKWSRVRGFLSDGVKTLFFYRFIREGAILLHLSYELEGVKISGVKEYMKRPNKTEITHLIGHPASMGQGIDLREFDRIVYLSETPSAILAAQSAARMNVHGQDMASKKIIYMINNDDYSKRLRRAHKVKESYLAQFFADVKEAQGRLL